ncbi:MAG TPA: hypothetical protein VM580_16400 [Labilithrix sp.]|nr:hypothetical protein [Labilithrix sp.]
MDRAELEGLDREGLVMRAQAAGIRRARVLTRPELIDELLRLDPELDQDKLRRTRGFFGVARDLLSRVVERGLHLPDAADRLRVSLGMPLQQVTRPEPQAVPTVTLAGIYAAQGHKQRAIETLKRVLEVEPGHGTARSLLEQLEAADYVAPPPPLPPEDDSRDVVSDVTEEVASAERTADGPVRASDEAGARVDTTKEHAEAFLHVATTTQGVEGDAPEDEAIPATSPVFEPMTLPRATIETECVAIPVDGGGLYVWWRLSASARASTEDARFIVRALVLVPTWDGPQRETRDIACDPSAGELVLRDLPERAIVRVAIGMMCGADFVPLAHSPALESSVARGLVRWTPEGALPVVLDDPRSASIARAAEGASRATDPGDSFDLS